MAHVRNWEKRKEGIPRYQYTVRLGGVARFVLFRACLRIRSYVIHKMKRGTRRLQLDSPTAVTRHTLFSSITQCISHERSKGCILHVSRKTKL